MTDKFEELVCLVDNVMSEHGEPQGTFNEEAAGAVVSALLFTIATDLELQEALRADILSRIRHTLGYVSKPQAADVSAEAALAYFQGLIPEEWGYPCRETPATSPVERPNPFRGAAGAWPQVSAVLEAATERK